MEATRVTVTMYDSVSFKHPIARLRRIINLIEPTLHPDYHYSIQDIFQYFTLITWMNVMIHPRFVELYVNNPTLFEVMFHVDSIVEVHSKYLDDNLYDNFFYDNFTIPQSWQSVLSPLNLQHSPQASDYHPPSLFDYLFTSDMISSMRSSYSVVQPLKRIKIACFYGSLGLLGLSLTKLARGRVFLSSTMMFGSMELLRVSYNSYDRRYNTIYRDQLFGDSEQRKKTGLKTFSSLMGRIHPFQNPFYKVHHHINWKILVKDTLCEDIYNQVIDRAQLFLFVGNPSFFTQ